MYDDEFKKRRNKVLGIQDTSSSKPSNVTSNDSDFQKRRDSILNATKPVVTEKPSQVAQVEQKKKGFLEKAGDFIKNTFNDKIKPAFQKEAEVIKNNFVTEFNVQKQNATDFAQGKISYNDYHRMSTIPPIQLKIKELNDEQNKKYSEKRQKEIQDLESIVADNSGSIGSIIKRNNTVVKLSNKQTKKSIGAGVLESTASMADAVTWASELNAKNYEKNPLVPQFIKDIQRKKADVLGKGSDKVSGKLKLWADELRPEMPTFTDQLAEGVGSALTFFVPSIGAGKLTSVLAQVSPRVALFFASSSATALEAMSEAGSVYDDNLKQGKDKEESSKKASATFWANAFTIGISNKLGIFGENKTALKRLFASAFFEGGQEAIQSAISNVNTGKEATDGMLESGIIGAIIGGSLSGFDAGSDARDQTASEAKVINIIADKEQVLQGKTEDEEPDKNVPDVIKQALTQENGQPVINQQRDDVGVTSLNVNKTDPTPLVEEAKKYKTAEEFIQAFTNKTNYVFGDTNIPKESSDLLNAFVSFAQAPQYQKLYAENKISDIDVLKDFYNQAIEKVDQTISKVDTKEIVSKEEVKKKNLPTETVGGIPITYTKDKVEAKPKVESKKEGLVLAPSKVVKVKELVDEINRVGFDGNTGVSNAFLVAKTNSKGEQEYTRPKIGKTDIKTLIANNKEFMDNPVLEVEAGKPIKDIYNKESTPDKVLVFKGKKSRFALIPEAMQLNSDNLKIGDKINVDVEAFKTAKGTVQQTRVYKAGKAYASAGKFADLKNLSKKLDTQIKVIEFPELVRMVRELTGSFPSVVLPRPRPSLGGGRPNGFFVPTGDGKIALNREIFRDEAQASKTLAHEMGHLADYFPDKTMARGNIIGRIASLNRFLREKFSGVKVEAETDILLGQRRSLRLQRKRAVTEGNRSLNLSLLKEIKGITKKLNAIHKTIKLRNSVVTTELKKLTQIWKPFDENENPSFTKYRYSTPELYADAVSVLFNDPALLKETAPTFWNGFFEHIDRKPAIKDEFFKTWDLLVKGEDAILSQREQDIRNMFVKGEDKFKVLLEEKKQKSKDYSFRLKYELIDKNQRLIDKVAQLKKQGIFVADELNPVYMLEEHNYVGGLVKNFVEENIQPIYEELNKNNVNWEDLGEILFLERVVKERGAVKSPILQIKGLNPDLYNNIISELPQDIEEMGAGKQIEVMKKELSKLKSADGKSLYSEVESLLPKGLANPLGFNVETAQTQLDFLKKNLGDKFAIVEKLLPKYREAIKSVLDEAQEAGFYKESLIAEMKANPAYATYQVLDYMDTNISASIKQQVGTLKEIANPATSTLVKTISMIRAIERNKVKTSIVNFLKTNYSEEIIDAKTVFNGKTQMPVEPKDKNLALFTVMENGVFKGYYIDPYIASTMEYSGTGEANAVLGVIKFFNSKLYRPLFITFNLGFQGFNLFKDFLRLYKNTPNMTLWRALVRYKEALPSAKARAWGGFDETIAKMEKGKMLGVTYNDIVSGMSEDEKQLDYVMAKVGLSSLTNEKKGFIYKTKVYKVLNGILDTIEKSGNFIETLPKVSGYNELNGKLPNKQLGSFIRTSIGSPDFLRRGAGSAWYNEVFLFANAIKEGVRSDLNVAFVNPTTRSGYWWKTAKVTFTPKLLMFGALAGLFGDALRKMFEDISEYDKTNYIIIPIGRKNNQTTYIRMPQDETGRLLGGILWKVLRAGNNEQSIAKDAQDLLSFTGGQVPSLSPTLTTIFGISQFLAGQNPYDFFRGRNVINDLEFEAGGKYAFKPFATWVFNQLGGGTFFKTYITEQTDKTWYQKTLDLPIVSNILGRWIKVSDQGQKDMNRDILKGSGKASAVKSLEIRNKVDNAIKLYQKDPSMTNKYEVEKQLITDVLGHESPVGEDERRTKTNTLKKFRLGIVRGQGDPNVNSLIDATSNAEKVELLKEMKKRMSESEFNEIYDLSKKEDVISRDVEKEFNKVKDNLSELKIGEKLVADIFMKSKFSLVSEVKAFDEDQMFNYGLPISPVEEKTWQEKAKDILKSGFRKLLKKEDPAVERKFPYRLESSFADDMVRIVLPNGVKIDVKEGKEQAQYLQGWQNNYVEMTGQKWPDNAPDWNYQMDEYKKAEKKPENVDVVSGEVKLGAKQHDDVIDKIWGDQSENAKIILTKENAERKTGAEIDIANRIDPKTGMWSDDAPIKKGINPVNKEEVDSIDRGLFRINNITYYTWLNGKKERAMMYEAGIIDKPYLNKDGLDNDEVQKAWDAMLDPEKNTKFAKLLYDNWGAEQWAVVRQKLVALK